MLPGAEVNVRPAPWLCNLAAHSVNSPDYERTLEESLSCTRLRKTKSMARVANRFSQRNIILE